MRCIDGPTGCGGEVQMRTTPDRTDGKPFARCAVHFDRRMASVDRNLEYQSPSPPAWFDPGNAGERWDDE